MKATAAVDLPRSLMFLDNPLADKTSQEWTSTDMIAQVVKSTTDLEVKVDNVILSETEKAPYRALIDYTVMSVDPASRREMEQKRYTATIHYTLSDRIPNWIIQENPIGLNITYFRSDEGFRREP
jgi:type IV secretory pathway component VirB8